MSSKGIRAESVVKTYRGGKVRALDGISLEVAPGEIIGVIGPNGAGKTTFIGCLLGFLRPDSGRITIDGLPPDDLAIRSVTGYLPERLVFDRWMTGRDFLRYHHELARLASAKRADDIAEVLARMEMTEAADKPIRKYSRGMLQRIGFAAALLGAPRYLFLDEPTSGVDPAGLVIFRRALKELKERGVTVLHNSHQLDEVERVCDRAVFVRGGKVVSIEKIDALSSARRVLRVRTAGGWLESVAHKERLGALAITAGGELIEVTVTEAKFSLAGDEAAARLIAALVAAQVPVIEATPEESRLEQLFLQNAQA